MPGDLLEQTEQAEVKGKKRELSPEDIAKMLAIGQRITTAMDAARYNQLNAAIALDIDPATMRRFQSGQRTPNALVLSKMAKLFNVDADYLLCEQNDPRRPTAPLVERSNNTVERSNNTNERESFMLRFQRDNGKWIEIPPTPEGYEFFHGLCKNLDDAHVAMGITLERSMGEAVREPVAAN